MTIFMLSLISHAVTWMHNTMSQYHVFASSRIPRSLQETQGAPASYIYMYARLHIGPLVAACCALGYHNNIIEFWGFSLDSIL